MIGTLVLENLKHRPMRSLLSVVLIGVPVTLILALVGLTNGMLEDSQRRQRGVGADVIIRGSTATSVASMTGEPIPEGVVKKVNLLPHIKLAMGVINRNIELPLVVTGIDPDSFKKMTGGFVFLKGHNFERPDDVLIDELYATQKRKNVGDTITIMGHPWHIAGIIQTGKLARIAVQLKTLQDLVSANGRLSQIYITVDDPKNTDAVVNELHNVLPDYQVITMPELVAMYNAGSIPGVREFTEVIMALGVIIGFLVVYLSMYMSVLQRTREIGILKSLGASKAFILTIVEVEALMLGVGGTILGILMSYAAYWLIRTIVPASIPMIIVKSWWPIAGGITLIGALFGALYPGMSAARHDPIEALAYE